MTQHHDQVVAKGYICGRILYLGVLLGCVNDVTLIGSTVEDMTIRLTSAREV